MMSGAKMVVVAYVEHGLDWNTGEESNSVVREGERDHSAVLSFGFNGELMGYRRCGRDGVMMWWWWWLEWCAGCVDRGGWWLECGLRCR